MAEDDTPSAGTRLKCDLPLTECVLVVDAGPDAGRHFGNLRERTTVGRDSSCDVRLSDPHVGERHLEVEYTEEGFHVRVLGSESGMVAAGVRNYDVVLPVGTPFEVGSTTLRIKARKDVHDEDGATFGPCSTLLCASAPMRELFRRLLGNARGFTHILLRGEPGTGKSAIAEAMHQLSDRHLGPFVYVDCREPDADALARTINGHRIAGSDRHVPGAFETASGGSVFLDHVDFLPARLQNSVFAILDLGKVYPEGTIRPIPVDVRVFAATRRNLRAYVEAGQFKPSLYYQLGVPFILPPLRERVGDIKVLAWHFMRCEAERLRASQGTCPVESISPEAETKLEQLAWHENVRELQAVIQRAVNIAEGPTIEPEHISEDALFEADNARLKAAMKAAFDAGRTTYAEFRALCDEITLPRYLLHLLTATHGDMAEAVRVSGIPMPELLVMLKKTRL